MEKFTGNWDKRLSEEMGKIIYENGNRLGDGGHFKDCYWAGYEMNGKYYISLNDYHDAFWETSYEDMKSYCLES